MIYECWKTTKFTKTFKKHFRKCNILGEKFSLPIIPLAILPKNCPIKSLKFIFVTEQRGEQILGNHFQFNVKAQIKSN